MRDSPLAHERTAPGAQAHHDAVTLDLTSEQRAAAAGEFGQGVQRAMILVLALARATGATSLIPITRAHVDAALYHGPSSLDFVEWLSAAGARVAVPTTLNVASLDLLHPWTFGGDPMLAEAGRQLVDAYVRLGCEPTLTCAPYQAADRPRLGEQVAWAESNAIVFVNSVLGARTARYGDFIDAAAAVAGWVPLAGLHVDENRRASLVVDLEPEVAGRLTNDAHFGALGLVVGSRAGNRVPAFVGLPDSTDEDALKALGAAAASSGAVAMFHAVGITPEAGSLAACVATDPAPERVSVGWSEIRAAMASLATVPDGPIDAVCLGTPHFSVPEFRHLREVVLATPEAIRVEFVVTTARAILAEIETLGWRGDLGAAGIEVLTDTCSYVSQVTRHSRGVVMTNSAKWAFYAPANMGSRVIYGSLAECVASAKAGTVVRLEA